MNKNYLFFNSSNKIGGAEKSFLELLSGFDYNEKKDISIILPNEKGNLKSKIKNLGYKNIYSITIEFPYYRNHKDFFICIKKVINIMLKHNVDVVYSNQPQLSFFLVFLKFWFFLKCKKIKTIIHIRNILSFRFLFINLIFLNNELIFNSYYTKEKTLKCFTSKLLKRKTHIIYNSINVETEKIKSISSYDENKKIIIGMFGRIVKWKNYHYVLNILSENNNLLKCVDKILFVGFGQLSDREYEDYLLKLINSDSLLRKKVKVLEFKDNIWPYYNMCDFIIIPSVGEPFGRIAIEAGALKKPVLASKSGGLLEIIDDSIDGYLWAHNNKDEFIYKYKKLCNNQGTRKKLGKNLNKKVKNLFSTDTYVNNMIKILNN
jgi:glycosyltransferase involved in cell wall biosynthesis